MATAAHLQATESTAKGKRIRIETMRDGQSETFLGIAPFGTSLVERTSTAFAGLGLRVAFGLTGTILGLTIRM